MPLSFPSPALAPITPTLAAMLEGDTLPHALLLEGGTEAVRREAAVALARILLCAQSAEGGAPDTEDDEISLFGEPAPPEARALPCEACPHCRKTAGGIHPDLKLLEGGSGARSFHIDAVRGMRQDCYILPNEAQRKVYVLHNAHTMTAEAQNALLKMLEEPPDYVCIILTAPNRRQMLQTVISRATALSLGEAAEEPLEAERAAKINEIAQALATALLRPRTPYALLEATAPLEGDKDLVREVLPACKQALHGAIVKDHSLASRALTLVAGLGEMELAMERNANLNLLVTRLALLGVKEREAAK